MVEASLGEEFSTRTVALVRQPCLFIDSLRLKNEHTSQKRHFPSQQNR